MLKLENGIVVKILNQTKKIQIILVKHAEGESKGINYFEFNPSLQLGDQVIINRTATSLELGSGGYDFIVCSINPKNINKKNNGHIMKLRYTPYQFSVKTCEEQSSKYHDIFINPKMLDNLPVIIGELHSMLPILITTIRKLEEKYKIKKKKIVYIMTDGGALPIELSKHVAKLKEMGWLDHTITVGNAFGGDLEAVNIYSGLIAAKHILNADIIIVLMGPGIVGTGTWIGHTGIEQGIIANAVSTLKGLPVCIIRASSEDNRERHYGISHHSLTVLKHISLLKNIVPYPQYINKIYPNIYNELVQLKDKHQLEKVDINNQELINFLKEYPIEVTTMNRTIHEDYLFFDFVASSAYWVFNQLNNFK